MSVLIPYAGFEKSKAGYAMPRTMPRGIRLETLSLFRKGMDTQEIAIQMRRSEPTIQRYLTEARDLIFGTQTQYVTGRAKR